MRQIGVYWMGNSGNVYQLIQCNLDDNESWDGVFVLAAKAEDRYTCLDKFKGKDLFRPEFCKFIRSRLSNEDVVLLKINVKDSAVLDFIISDLMAASLILGEKPN